jgi:hypothetical protein
MHRRRFTASVAAVPVTGSRLALVAPAAALARQLVRPAGRFTR